MRNAVFSPIGKEMPILGKMMYRVFEYSVYGFPNVPGPPVP